MRSSANRNGKRLGVAAEIVRAALGGSPSGAGFGAWVGALAVRENPSLRGPGQGAGFVLLQVAVYAVLLALVGIAAAIFARPFGRSRAREEDGYLADFVAPLAGAITFALMQNVLHRVMPGLGESAFVPLAIALAACLAVAVTLRALLARVGTVANACWGAIAVVAAVTPVFVWITLRSHGGMQFGPANAEDPARATNLPTAQPHVILIAIDGADWEYLTPLVSEGRAPNFARLCAGAYTAQLNTLEPSWSASVWTSIATGVRDDEHGVMDIEELKLPMLERGVQRARDNVVGEPLLPRNVGLVPAIEALTKVGVVAALPVSAPQRRYKAFWNVLTERGVRCAIVRWPVTWPADKLEGYMVGDNDPLLQAFAGAKLGSGANSQTAQTTWPPELTRELLGLVDADGPFARSDGPALDQLLALPLLADLSSNDRVELRSDAHTRELLELLVREDQFAARAAEYLWKERTLSLVAVRFTAIAGVGHCVPRVPGVVARAYEFTDQLLGRVLALGDANTTFVVVSQHGARDPSNPDPAHEQPPPGVLIIRGPGVIAEPEAKLDPTVLDVAPTLLAMFGLPPAKDWPGRALTEIFAPDSAAAQVREPVESYGAYRPAWPEFADMTELASQREALRLLHDLDALGR